VARSDRGSAVTPFGLKQDCRLSTDVHELLGDAKSIVEIGDDDRDLTTISAPRRHKNANRERMRVSALPSRGACGQ
jgi:hypothetical protein